MATVRRGVFFGLFVISLSLLVSFQPVKASTPIPGTSIVFDSSGSPNPQSCLSCGSPGTISWTHTVGVGSNGFLIVGVSYLSIQLSTPTVTFGAATMTLLGIHPDASHDQAGLWGLAVSSGAFGTITVTLPSGSPDFMVGGSASYFNVAGTGTANSNDGPGASGSVAVTTSVGDLVVDTLAVSDVSHNSGPVTISPAGPGQAQLWKLDGFSLEYGGTDFYAGGGSEQPASGSSTTMSWSLTTQDPSHTLWSLVAVPLIPVTTPPIPEYPLGLPILAILTILAYGTLRRRTRNQ
ncbi:MAG: hypothetical protein ACLP9D_01850 [Candidatus Bathyarchaeia archaeon]